MAASIDRLWEIDEITPWNVHDAPRIRGDVTCSSSSSPMQSTPLPFTSAALLDCAKAEEVPPFTVRRDLNARVRLWQGHQFALHADVVTSTSTGGGASDPDVHDAKLQLRPAFSRILEALRRRRHTDLHIIAPKGLIPAQVMLHSCAPRYSPRYHTAAENALSQCFRVFLETAAERGCRTIALGNHSRHGKMYPTRLAAHIAIRTIRSFLERVKNPFEAIVICTASHNEYVAFRDIMRCYFPRDDEEAIVGARALTKIDVGDDIGEAWLPEREIQIKHAPVSSFGAGPSRSAASPLSPSSSPALSSPAPATPEASEAAFFRTRPNAVSPLTPLSQDGDNDADCRDDEAFMSPAPAPDAERSKRLAHPLITESLPRRINAHTRAVWSKRALCADLSEVNKMKIFNYAGTDLCGRKILLFVGAHVKNASCQEVLFQCIREIEGVGDDHKFIIIYAYSCIDARSVPSSPSSSPASRAHAGNPLSLDFLSVMHSLLRAEQRCNLEAVLMLHASLSLRTAVHFRQFGVGSSLWRKVVFCSMLKDLWRFVDERHIQLPEFIRIEDRGVTRTSAVAAGA